MHPERVFEVIHNLRVPEARRKFWPKWSVVYVTSDGIAIDVVSYFERPTYDQLSRDIDRYPNTVYFYAIANETYASVEELEAKIRGCMDAFSPDVSALLAETHNVSQLDGQWKATSKKPPGSDGDA